MKKIYSLVLLLFIVYSCKNEDSDLKDFTINKPKIGDQINIETLFDQTTFPSSVEHKLLKELEICFL